MLGKYARHKLWALLYPIAWVGDTNQWFRAELPERLAASRCPHHIVGANWSVDDPVQLNRWTGQGHSTIYGPCGKILASSDKQVGEDIVYATLPTEAKLGPREPLDLDKYRAAFGRERYTFDAEGNVKFPK
eukprot:NODE_5893_length_670_cov_40.788214_g5870_i0.p2 GENE.NODE_5893_length_670_cov_40.788214_g5870_i0~~NODE_5893_length_670_cov_40.788214_g5870_i0.p2  ORF type:complete len:131 (+),score=19.89 NODE_5893_length_670_cov_40.788214_g5870_i0:226-618(+)